jgi:hypothetical protein
MKYLWTLGIATTAIVIGTACGGSSGGGTAGGGAGTNGSCATGMGAPAKGSACASCLQAHCATETNGCYGAGWQSGNFSGGGCSELVTCSAACACGDTSCQGACVPKVTAACTTCSSAVSSCQSSHCSTECSTTTSGGAGTGGGVAGAGATSATCADLAKCCASTSLPAQSMSGCTQVVQSKNDSVCGQLYDSLNMVGYCK